jgi:hypothetical protein
VRDGRAIASGVEIFDVAGHPVRYLAKMCAVHLVEPAHALGLEARDDVPLWSQVAAQVDGLPSDLRELGPEPGALLLQERLLDGIDDLVQIGQNATHPQAQPVHHLDEEVARVRGSAAAGNRCHDVFDGHHPPPPEGDDAAFFDPHTNRDHVLRVGAGIEVHTAEDHEETAVGGKAPRPRLLLGQGFRDHGVEPALLGDPALDLGALVVEVQPEKAPVRPPRANLVPAHGPAAAPAIELIREDESVLLRHPGYLSSAIPGIHAPGSFDTAATAGMPPYHARSRLGCPDASILTIGARIAGRVRLL